jgi:hypothetical protein
MSSHEDLFSKSVKSDRFSQNGEDGIIAALFDRLGTGMRRCCEFGAWDGVHLSNCRSLVLQGWECLFIEGDATRYNDLVRNYQGNERVHAVCAFVDHAGNSVEKLMRPFWQDDHLDFLSIDIDGLDYEILRGSSLRPRVICIEVNAGHSPFADAELPRTVARDNVGQPLQLFVSEARRLGYQLVGYTANAFFVRNDEMARMGWSEVSPAAAYEKFLSDLPVGGKEWLYLVNLGLAPPHHRFGNPYLSSKRLGIGRARAAFLVARMEISKVWIAIVAVARRIKRIARAAASA